MTLALAILILGSQPALAGNLTLPFADSHPRITAWMDHHYPDRQADGIMIRFDGATWYPYDGHRGTDFAEPPNTPVVAADDGTVIYSEWSDTGGWGVVIDHADNRTAYFHNTVLYVYPGQHVSHGQLIALSGSTGNSTGPHVHFEVRDLLDPWHSIDPFGWTGRGADPWQWDRGYLWSSSPPTPFLLPLTFLGGAHWNYWYGLDGPPPPVSWQIRDGWGHGLGGFAARWDQDPGPEAARTYATSGSAALPGPGAHTLHLRVWDGRGVSADVTYTYLYDTDPPTAALEVETPSTTAVPIHWTGTDATSGVKDVSLEVAVGAGEFRPWLVKSISQSEPGTTDGWLRFYAEPGAAYRFRLAIRDQARNAAPPVTGDVLVPATASRPASSLDQAVLGALPEPPPGGAALGGIQQEHPQGEGGLLLSSEGSLHELGAAILSSAGLMASGATAVDVVTTSTGPLRLLADGTTWRIDGTAGPRFALGQPVRLLSGSVDELLAVGADGSLAGAPGVTLSSPPSAGTSLVDAGTFAGSNAGLALDSGGGVHAFGGADAALIALPTAWTLAGQPDGILVAGTPDAPAGFLLDAAGHRQPYGSLLLLPDRAFSGPTFDPFTGLPVR